MAQFIATVVTTLGVGFLAVYARAIKAEFWNKIFAEADQRYVAVRDCALVHGTEILKLREEIVMWRVEDRHAMRNEVTVCLGQAEERIEERLDELKAEVTRIRDRGAN